MSYYIKVDRQSDLPMDTVQSIMWDPYDKNCKSFFTCGWDGYVRYYEIQGSSSKRLQKRWEYYFHHPVTAMDVTSSRLLIAGLATGQIGLVDMQNVNNVMVLGSHDAPICKVVWIEKFQVLVSLAFDNLIKVFTLKNPQNNNHQISQYTLPSKTNTVSYSHPYILIGAQDSRIALLNMEKINQINFNNQYQNIFDQSHGIVKFATSALFTPKGRIVLGTVDGRLVSTSFTEVSGGVRISKPTVVRFQKKSSFRKQTVGHINSVDYGIKQSKYEFILFCGTQQMGVFHPQKNQKIKTLGSSSVTVTALSISPDGEYYAFAVGSDWSKGMEELSSYVQVKLNVGRLTTSQVTPMTSAYLR